MKDIVIVTTDKTKIDFEKVVQYLNHESYWAKDRSREIIQKSIENSICFSLLLDDVFIGFARIVTDYCTFSYLCDVFVLTEYQRKQYGHKLMEYIINDEEIKTTFKILLTKTAHEFYMKFGFENEDEMLKKVMYKK